MSLFPQDSTGKPLIATECIHGKAVLEACENCELGTYRLRRRRASK